MYNNRVMEVKMDNLNPDFVTSIILQSRFSKDEIECVLELTKIFLEDYNPSEVTKLFGPNRSKLLRRVNIFSHENSGRSILHFRELLRKALDITINGGFVHLIESLDSKYNLMTNDVDLFFTNSEGIINACDVTSSHKSVKEKMAKLESLIILSSNFTHNSSVHVFKSREVIGKPKILSDIKCAFDAEFEIADQLIEEVQHMSMSEIINHIHSYADNLTYDKDQGGAKSKELFSREKEKLIGMVSSNEMDRDEFLSIMNNLSDRSKERLSFNIDDFHHEGLKPSFMTSPSQTSTDKIDPFVRCGEMGCFWGIMVYQCYLKGKIDSDDFPKSARSIDYIPGLIFERAQHEDVKMNMIWITSKRDRLCKVLGSGCKTKRTEGSYSFLEEEMSSFCKKAEEAGYKSWKDDLMDQLNNLEHDSHKVEKTLTQARQFILNESKGSKMWNLLTYHHELAAALAHTHKKFKYFKKKGSIMSKKCLFSLDSVGNMLNVCLSNYVDLNNKFKNGSCFVIGDDSGLPETFVNPHVFGGSVLFNYCPKDLNWWVLLPYKWISLHSMILESRLSNWTKKDLRNKSLRDKDAVYQMLLLFTNSSKFSQVAEQVRYFFLNSTGMGGTTKPLWNKISWYKPKTVVESIYLMRMRKMVILLEWFKLNNCKDLLTEMTTVSLNEPNAKTKRINTVGWKVAMPHESRYVVSEGNIFNSFYISKCITTDRQNKLVSEAQVVQKVLNSREDYLKVHRNYEMCSFEEAVLKPGGGFNPNLHLTALYAGYSCLLVHGSWEEVYKLNDYSYDISTTTLTEVMNNRGSTTYPGKDGLSVVTDKSFNQNSKCYATVMEEMTFAFMNDSRGNVPFSGDSHTKEKTLIPEHNNTNLWHALFNILDRNLSFVNRMCDKEGGIREIAIMNAAGRILTYFIEKFARKIRTNENNSGDFSNLMENKFKDDIVDVIYAKSLTNEGVAIYDCADCSEWGPRNLSYNLYVSLCMRVKDPFIKSVIRKCFKMFSNKIFKLPDVFYDHSLSHSQKDMEVVSKTMNRCKNAPPSLCVFKHQHIPMPEGIIQGLAGCSTGVFGSDVLRASNLITLKLQPELEHVESFSTSDDYSRVLLFRPDSKKIMKSSLISTYIIQKVQEDVGIKRNMVKSTVTGHYLEFNSVFRSRNGTFTPDIKSRLSYVDYHHDFDLYSSALNCMTKSVQFVRSEGSILGGSILQFILTFMHLEQHQLLSLIPRKRSFIFSLPLELGGILSMNTLKHAGQSTLDSLSETYGGVNLNENLLYWSNLKAGMISIDEDESSACRVPRVSRSGIINICRKPPREKRAMRDYIMRLDPSIYVEAVSGVRGTMISVLMSCLQRESNTDLNLPSYLKFITPQVPADKKIFRRNTNASMQTDLPEVFSRRELIEYAEKWYKDDCTENDGKEECILIKDNFDQFSYRETMSRLNPSKLTVVPRVQSKTRVSFMTGNAVIANSLIKRAASESLPKAFGGHSDMHPSEFLECIMTLRQKLQKMVSQQVNFSLTSMSGDKNENIYMMLLRSSFVDNCRMSFEKGTNLENIGIRNTIPKHLRDNMQNIRFCKDGLKLNLNTVIPHNTKVSELDITDVLNECDSLKDSDKTELFTNLYSISSGGRCDFTLRTSDLRLRKQSTYKSHMSSVWTNSRRDECVSNVVISSSWGPTYDYVLLEEDVNVSADKYKNDLLVTRLTGPKVRVKLEMDNGFLVLTDMQGWFIYSVLGVSYTAELRTYDLVTTIDDLIPEQLFNEMTRIQAATYSPIEPKEHVIDYSDLAHENEKESEEELDLLDSDSEMDELLSRVPNFDLDESDDWSEGDWSEDDLSDLGSISHNTGTLKDLRQNLYRSDNWAINSVRQIVRNYKNRKKLIRIVLPFDTGKKVYEDDDEMTAMEKLVQDTKTEDEGYSNWAISRILLALRSSELTRNLN